MGRTLIAAPRIERAIYRVKDLDTSVSFYRALGMHVRPPSPRTGGSSDRLREKRVELKFPDDDQGAILELIASEDQAAKRPAGKSSYWKIGITVDDLGLECQRLLQSQIRTTSPARFSDVGVLCHATDPDGFGIELLQRTFEAPAATNSPNLKRLSHITYRVHDLKLSLRFYRDLLGMSVLSQVLVASHDFGLCFLAIGADIKPPGMSLQESREWLWQRPYTLLELWHSTATVPDLERDLGFGGIDLTGMGKNLVHSELSDPEGYRLRLR